jgi:CheY-like chemotaxis protein
VYRRKMKKILIIEDDPIAARIYEGCLQKAGYQTEVAADGQMGFERLLEFQPDGILLDLMMPQINGIDLLRAIRGLAEFGDLPVIAYTNAFIPVIVQEAVDAGATKVLDKSKLTPSQLTMEFGLAFQPGT